MTRIFLLLLMFSTLSVLAQDEPGTQVTAVSPCGSCTFISGTLTGATSSAPAYCDGTGNDVFFTFTAPSPTYAPDLVGISVTLINSSFDGVIEILDAGLGNVACENSEVGTADENLVHYGFTTGQVYHVRISSATGVIGAGTFEICIEQIPELFLRPNYLGLGLSGDGYSINEVVNREFFNNPGPITKTGWLFVCDDDGSELYKEVNGTSTILNLNQVGGICYDKTYTVFVRVMIGGAWCGYGEGRQIIMEPTPLTNVLPVYCGQTYDLGSGILGAVSLSNEQQFEWMFTTDNGNTTFTALGTPGISIIQLEDIPQMRYNKVYQVQVRARICGEWGPWSAICVVIIGPLPYTYLEPVYCNTTVTNGAVLLCEFVTNADTYVWQLAPIECGDASFVPTGPAQLFYQSGPALSLQLATLTPGTCYRVGVKAFVGEQQADYGSFCQILTTGTAPTAAPSPGSLVGYYNPETGYEGFGITEESFTIYPNPSTNGDFALIFNKAQDSSTITFMVYDATGKLIHSERQANNGDITYRLGKTNFDSGMYIIHALDESNISIARSRVVVR